MIGDVDPGKSIDVRVELPPSTLLNDLSEQKNLSIKMLSKEQVVVDSSNLMADINIPKRSVYFEQRNGTPTVIIVFDNSGREKRTGIEVELFLSRDGKVIYEDFFGPFKIEKGEKSVKEIRLVPDYLSSGKVSVQAKFFEKGVLIDDSYSESEINADNIVPKRAILIIVTIIVLIVALYFSLMLMFRRMFPR